MKLSDLKPALSPENKSFINNLSNLYLKYGNLDIVAKKMEKTRVALLERLDSILRSGALIPIKNRRTFILSLRIKRSYDKIGRTDLTAKKYGFSDGVISRYLRYGDRAGLFKYPNLLQK